MLTLWARYQLRAGFTNEPHGRANSAAADTAPSSPHSMSEAHRGPRGLPAEGRSGPEAYGTPTVFIHTARYTVCSAVLGILIRMGVGSLPHRTGCRGTPPSEGRQPRREDHMTA